MKIRKTILVATGVFVGTALVWRWSSRRKQMPCPAWLAWILDNRLTEAVAGTEVTLDRIGLQPRDRCLDVGCGPGRLSLPAAQRVGPDGEIVALDIQPAMLAKLRQRLARTGTTNVTLLHADITTAGILSGEQFDRAWLVTVLGEIPNQQRALMNLRRLLKPGGILSVTEIFPDPHFQSQATVMRLCQQAGFIPAEKWGMPLAFTRNFTRPL